MPMKRKLHRTDCWKCDKQLPIWVYDDDVDGSVTYVCESCYSKMAESDYV